MYVDRWEWTFGSRSIDPEVATDFTPSADKALAMLWEQRRPVRHVGRPTMTDEQLDVPGFGQYPYGLDPQLPFISIVWWMNRELIHHTAEVALLRDLYLRRDRPRKSRYGAAGDGCAAGAVSGCAAARDSR